MYYDMIFTILCMIPVRYDSVSYSHTHSDSQLTEDRKKRRRRRIIIFIFFIFFIIIKQCTVSLVYMSRRTQGHPHTTLCLFRLWRRRRKDIFDSSCRCVFNNRIILFCRILGSGCSRILCLSGIFCGCRRSLFRHSRRRRLLLR